MKAPLAKGWGVLRNLGPGWAMYRVRRKLALSSGWHARHSPVATWSSVPLPAERPKLDFFPLTVPTPPAGERFALLREADAILGGWFRLFGGEPTRLGNPPRWHENPLSGQESPALEHWSKLDEFAYGDVKALWELGRFGWAFVLARAHAQTSNRDYAEAFWALFEDFCAQNAPNAGIHWRCGQETSLRLIACTFAVSVLRESDATSERRLQAFARFAHASRNRVEAHLAYALSQKNNHGISECVGLLTYAALFPTGSERSSRQALARLGRQVTELLYPDGGFAQHSLGYQRLLVNLLTWAHYLEEQSSGAVPEWLTEALERALGLLEAFADPATGRGPNYGPDDGSQLLRVQSAEYADLRPSLDAAVAALRQPRRSGLGATENAALSEASAWFEPRRGAAWRSSPIELHGRLPSAVKRLAVTKGAAWHAPHAGAMCWRNDGLRLDLRCPTVFRHRPTQLDMLHVSLSSRGRAIALDPGTYSYNAEARFGDAFSSARVHSVPVLRGSEPAERLSRFLFHPWPTGSASFDAAEERFTASHSGYEARGVRLVREIQAPRADEFVIKDRVHTQQTTDVDLHWLLADLDWLLSEGNCKALLEGAWVSIDWRASVTPISSSLVRADPDSDRGWWAPRYLELAPAASLRLSFSVTGLLSVETRFSLRSLGGS